MNPDPEQPHFEVLPPEKQLTAAGTISARRMLYEHLLTVPTPQPVSPPTFSRADLEAPFAHRFGLAVVACWQGVQYYIAPSGIFTSFTKFFLRWFLALLLCVVAVGIPLLVAARFVDSGAAILESAMHHLMWACIYLVAACAILACLIAGLMLAFNRKEGQTSQDRHQHSARRK